jgi:OOP family OmpA-OmpF porin
VGNDASNSSELAELRELLLGPDSERLAELQERVKNRTLRAVDVADVLPDALLIRARRDPELRHALQPLLEDAILASVRKDPRVLAEALFPMISRAIRRALASALQSMVESLNQIVETSFTLRSIRWRIEALRTGKSYGEIALLRSLLYRVEQVFLIHKETGLLMQHVIADTAVVRDPDMVSAMLTAIQDFVHDSFGSGDEPLERLRVGELTVLVQHGPQAILAGVVRGTPPQQLGVVFTSALESIHRDCAEQIAAFDGDAAPLASCRSAMQACLTGQSPEGRRTSFAPVYVAAGILLLAIAAWLTMSFMAQRRWNSYISTLQSEPGIAVMHQERDGRQFTISGLRDPLARDPTELLKAAGIPAEKVRSNWEPYVSLAPQMAARREHTQLRSSIERQTIRFEVGQSRISYAGTDALQALVPQVKRLFETASAQDLRLELIGHTDERGSEQANARLALDRANEIAAALAADGIESSKVVVRSAASTQPLRTGQTERDRSFNRSVSFRVVPPSN